MTDAKLKSIVDRIERLEEEQKGLGDDKRDIYAEAKSAGYSPKALRKVIAQRKQKDAAEVEAEMDRIYAALGSNSYREAAKQLGISKSKLQRLVPRRENGTPTETADRKPPGDDTGTGETEGAPAPVVAITESCGGPQECIGAASLSGPQEDSAPTRPNGIPTPQAGVAPGPQDPWTPPPFLRRKVAA